MASRKKENAVAGLEMFEGRDVLQSTIRVTRAGDGLSQALAVEPAQYHIDDEVYVVLKTRVTSVSYNEIKETGTFRRVHTLAAELGTIVDGQLVAGVLEEQQLKIEQAKGIERLPFDEDDASE